MPLAEVTKVVGVPGSGAELLEEGEDDLPSPQAARIDVMARTRRLRLKRRNNIIRSLRSGVSSNIYPTQSLNQSLAMNELSL